MDYRLEQWINSPAGRHPLWDSVMRDAATWAEPGFIALIVIWFLFGWIRGEPRDRAGAIAAALAAGFALLVNQIIIRLWQRSRPFVAHPRTVHVLLAHSRDASFPSDHAAPAFAIAGALVLVHWRAGAVVLVLAAMMAYARVYCGDHYPADVAAGAGIGLVSAWLVSRPFANVVDALRGFGDALITTLHLPLPKTSQPGCQ